MSSRASSSTSEYTSAKVLAWARGLETFERIDFVYLLMHSLFPTELRYIHGVIDGFLKRDESLYTNSLNQANNFVRLSHFYENYDPRNVMANDGLRRQFIVDLSALHPLNFYCADIFFGVLQRAELGTWNFNGDSQKLLRELILITIMVARHAAFRFDNRLFIWNISKILSQKLQALKEAEEQAELARQETEEEPEQPKVDLIPAANANPVEHQPTITASGADRLPNGYYEHPHPPAAPFVEVEKNPQKPAMYNPNFPPLSAAVQSPLLPGGMVNHRPKAPSVPARMNENVGRNFYDCSVSSPTYPPKKTAEPSVIPRSNSVEHCDLQKRHSETPKVEKSAIHGGKGLAPQQSMSSTAEFPRLPSDSMPIRPNVVAPVAGFFPENMRSDMAGVGKRNSTEPEELRHAVPNAEQWPVHMNNPLPPGITGAFPRIYSITGPNGPRLPSHVPYMVQPMHPPNFPAQSVPLYQKPVSCYNCGVTGHIGEYCPRKKQLDPEEAEKYCPLQRDAKLYPEKGRPSSRLPGRHHT
ncbi:uncharacterized protein LOC129584566 isoform X2 [Paramacrobiotus metropolitanus]|uniref:uncharacterized protein LOC129584566 isoform X2 n=1 Tax=Paramacrobiotus metropolitanus TaxID=2943436 RepID=UPI0024456BC7|nr:uncharacterized protein LOC129584566 isoform X2 [Paramacrobiotus metropolitanus]